MAVQQATINAANPSADVPPIKNDEELKVVNPGEELFSFDYENSDPAKGLVILNDKTGLINEGDEVWLSSSSLPQTGSSTPAKYENGQVVYNGPRDTPNGYQTWPSDTKQVSFGASVGPDHGIHQGGTHFVPAGAPSLEADKIEQTSDTPLLPVGTESWTFNIPTSPSWIADATVEVAYWSDAPDAPNQGFMNYELSDKTFANGQLTVSDEVLPKLSEGDFYFVTFRGAGEDQLATAYMGLYGELPEPTPEPTEEPTAEPTVEPTVDPTEEPTEEPTVEPTEEPTEEPTVEPTEEPTEEPTVEPTEEPTAEPTVEPTEEPTAEPTVEPTEEPTAEPTVEPTEEPTAEPTVEPTEEPTAEPTVEPTEEPTAEPTVEPTEEPTAEPTVDPTEEPTVEPTAEPTEEPTADPTAEPTDSPEVPKAQEPESGDQVAPGEENLSYDSESSAPDEGKFVFNTGTDVENGAITVNYRTSPDAEPQTTTGNVSDGKLTLQGDDAFTDTVKDFNQLLITVQDAEGKTISSVLSGASVLALQSDIVDNRLGLPLVEAGAVELGFDVPAGFPTVAEDNFRFDVKFVDTQGQPVSVSDVAFTVEGETLIVNDPRVAELTAGTYFLYGEQQADDANRSAAAFAQPAADPVVSVSTWFGLFAPAAEVTPTPTEDPTAEPTADPTDDPTDEPTGDPTTEPTDDEAPTATAPPTHEAPEQDNSPKDDNSNKDELADTGASDGLLIAGSLALGLVILGAVALGLRRRGRHG
ncbi:PT domain-containing protein [Arthrobacter sp. MYb224]|uniref:PT domain-containing protein n=1 Tax=Arthrobacter sp. MYb224 TaxID=1848600 RepID=UPI00215842B6|nr:PT domain-containing protein [Arthrobacter sp. MYb224]